MRSPLFALTLCVSLVSGRATQVAFAEATSNAVWMNDFAAAEGEAKKLNRPLVIHFYGRSCPPCRQMEQDVLNSAQLLKALDSGFVAVKVCLDSVANSKYQTRFDIEAMPTDLILSPEGKVLTRTEGYVSKQNYLETIRRIDAKYAAGGKRLARSAVTVADHPKAEKQDVVKKNTSGPSKTSSEVVSTPGDKLVPPPSEPKKVVDIAKSSLPTTTPREVKNATRSEDVPSATETDQFLVAMGGYCPVTLRSSRSWKSGSPEIKLDYEGQTFYFTASEKRDEFKADPARYAPRLLGCDPVTLADKDIAVRGNVKFGAFFEGELFLFETAESRGKFKQNPIRYSRLQHALNPEDVKKVAVASGN